MIQDEPKKSIFSWIIAAAFLLLLISTSFAFGYVFGTREKSPIIIEQCENQNLE